ncbi:hypothetical protein ACFSJU_19480 [Paradesertivirga mongoliensis]|uniref:Uncharacterized protein n=1 Tax=Paradesertivirga mongoliensis TaxID=2100740 RepID=A0ABW4ZRY8_9SPHI|nr:hypothetical protein [Pedobacter mongoliensis]
MKKLFLASLCLLSSTIFIPASAQVKTVNYKNEFFKGSTALTSVRLNAGAVAFVSNDSDKAVEIICTDNATRQKWAARVDGYIHDAKMLGHNLLVVVSTDFTMMTRANSIYKAYLISSENGKVLKSKVLFTGNNEYYTIPYVLTSKDKKTLTLATRETALKRNVKVALGTVGALYTIKKTIDQGNRIKAFNVLIFDENLEDKGAISPDLPEGEFIGVQKTVNDDLYIAVSQNRKGITISQYLPGSEKSAKSVTEPYSYYGGLLSTGHLNDHVTFFADTMSNNAVYITGSFKSGDEYISMLNKYDFAGNQHKRFKKVFNKSEIKDMEKSFTPVDKEFKKLQLGSAKNMELVKVLIHDEGYFVVLSDDSWTAGGQYSGPMPYSEGLIVYNLDKNLAVRTVSTIPRYFIGPPKPCLTAYAKGNALYIMASHETHAKFVIGKINAQTGKLEMMQLTEPAKVGRTDYAGLDQAIISDNNIILPVLDRKLAIGKIKYDVQLYQLAW